MRKKLHLPNGKHFPLSFSFLTAIILITLSTQAFSQVPDAPDDFEAIPFGYDLLLSWSDNADNEASYVISREDLREQEDGGGCCVEFHLPANTTSFLDTLVVPNVVYDYYLQAINEYGESDFAEIRATLFASGPPTPEIHQAIPKGQTSIEVTFVDNSDLETAYELSYTLNPELGNYDWNWNTSIHIGGTTDSLIKATITLQYPLTTAYFKLRAFINDNGTYIYSSYSAVVAATTNDYPAPPTNFNAVQQGNSIVLTWTDNSSFEEGYGINRYIGEPTASGPHYSHTFTLPPNVTSFTDTTAQPNVEYTYRIEALNIYGRSTEQYAYAYATVQLTPPAPVILSALATGPYSIQISFVDNSDLEIAYEVQHSSSATEFEEGAWEGGGTISGDTLFVEFDGFEPGSIMYFRVRAIIEIGNDTYLYSPFSEVISAETLEEVLPDAPAISLATFVEHTSFTANWNAVNGATHYLLDVFYIKNGNYITGYESKTIYDTSHFVTGTKFGQRYGYVVRAVNGFGESLNSDTIRVAKIKDLTLRTVCSDSPSVYRRWRIINNNPFAVSVTWHVLDTTQIGTLHATPGESFFITKTISGLNKTSIVWLDDKLNEHVSIKSSTYKPCELVNYDAIARSYMNSEYEDKRQLLLPIQVYPNPVTDRFSVFIESQEEQEVEMEIINLHGQQMNMQSITSNKKVEVDATSYVPGIYILKIRSGLKVEVMKIFKH